MKNQLSDTEIALYLIRHIENPCVESQTGSNIRDFYIREANRLLASFENPFAKTFLENKIREYSQ
jgi:hypothetical protein